MSYSHRLSIAPMLDYTDRHDRYFLRMLSRHTLLYTEMIPANALVYANPEPFLRHDVFEHPVALQLGGSDANILAKASKMAEDAGYCEVNLNCGCPSASVQNGAFGACMMKDANHVAACISSMINAVKVPVTVKCRIGVDNDDSLEFFLNFIETVQKAGCKNFIVHARKAWLKGLSPKENREVPPLDYNRVLLLKKLHPELTISINGGIKTLEDANLYLNTLDGVMIGREAYENPWILNDADAKIFGDFHPVWNSRKELLEAYLPYIYREQKNGCPTSILTRHISKLFTGLKGARKYRQILSEEGPKSSDTVELLKRAMACIEE